MHVHGTPPLAHQDGWPHPFSRPGLTLRLETRRGDAGPREPSPVVVGRNEIPSLRRFIERVGSRYSSSWTYCGRTSTTRPLDRSSQAFPRYRRPQIRDLLKQGTINVEDLLDRRGRNAFLDGAVEAAWAVLQESVGSRPGHLVAIGIDAADQRE